MSYKHSICNALTASGKSEWTLSEIVVLAWKYRPKDFGLKGYADKYPDSNKISAAICGRGGLIGDGLLVRVGPKEDRRYRVATEADRREAAEIEAEIDRQRALLASLRGQRAAS